MKKKLFESIIKEIKEYSEAESPQEYTKNLIRIVLRVKFDLLDLDEIENTITDGSGDNGIDAAYIDETNKVVHLFQSKFNHTKNDKIDSLSQNSYVKGFITSCDEFMDENHKEVHTWNNELKKQYKIFHEIATNFRGSYELKRHFIISRKIDKKIVKYKNKEIEVIDIVDINQMLNEIGKEENYPDLKIPVIKDLTYDQEDFETKLCIVSLKAFKEALVGIEYKDLLFENVRYSYHKSNVNSAIKESLISENIKYFYLYNNGITIMVDKSSIRREILNLENASIINGGQTTYEILNSDLNDIDGQMLLRINTRTQKQEINDQIAINLNNQNKINSLFSYSKHEEVKFFKRELEEKTPYFLEIKENEFKRNNPLKKLNKNVIKLEDIIRISIVASLNSNAYMVKNSKNEMLSNTELVSNVISDMLNVETFNKIYPIWKTICSYITQHRSERRDIEKMESSEYKDYIEYIFINTADYLYLYTVMKHRLDIQSRNEFYEIAAKLYEIPELKNECGSKISKNTQSKAVFEKVDQLKF